MKTYGINNNNDKQIGFNFIGSKSGGKVFNLWNGSSFMGYSYDLGKALKNIKANKAATSLKKNKIINYPDSYMNNNLKHLGNPKNRFANRDYLLNNSKENFENKFMNNIGNKTTARKDLLNTKKKIILKLKLKIKNYIIYFNKIFA